MILNSLFPWIFISFAGEKPQGRLEPWNDWTGCRKLLSGIHIFRVPPPPPKHRSIGAYISCNDVSCVDDIWIISYIPTFQVNLGAYVTDGKYEVSVLVDRAVGASSIHDGELEIMLHRYYLMKSLEQVLVSCYCGRYSSSKILCCIVCQRCPLEGGGMFISWNQCKVSSKESTHGFIFFGTAMTKMYRIRCQALRTKIYNTLEIPATHSIIMVVCFLYLMMLYICRQMPT